MRKPAEVQSMYQAIVKDLGAEEDGNTWHLRDFKADFFNLPANFVGENGRSIHVSIDQWKNRILVSGDWPTTSSGKYCADCHNGQHNPQITVAATRPCDRIARDIRNRFLPEFNKRWEEVASVATEKDAYETSRDDMQTKLIAMIDGATKGNSREGMWAPTPYGNVTPSSDGEVCFDGLMYLPFDVAAEVIAVIEKWRATAEDL